MMMMMHGFIYDEEIMRRQNKWLLAVGVLVEAAAAGEDNEGNFSITKNRKFISFLQESISPLAEGHLTIRCVFDPFDLNLSSPHWT